MFLMPELPFAGIGGFVGIGRFDGIGGLLPGDGIAKATVDVDAIGTMGDGVAAALFIAGLFTGKLFTGGNAIIFSAVEIEVGWEIEGVVTGPLGDPGEIADSAPRIVELCAISGRADLHDAKRTGPHAITLIMANAKPRSSSLRQRLSDRSNPMK
jgi:hypothetical protein